MGGLAIIVVTHNSGRSVGALLDSIRATDRLTLPVRILVVDNGSTDGTRGVVTATQGVDLICCENIGYAAGINRGVSASADADAHLILNPDLTLLPGAIAALIDELADDRVGIVVPRVLGESGKLEYSLRRDPSLPRALGLNFTGIPFFSEYVSDQRIYAGCADVEWALGASLLVAKRCRTVVGDWDESFFLYSEETDYCLRARDAGWSIRFTPRATVVHTGGGSGRSDKTHMMQIINRVRFYARRHGTPWAWLYWGATLLSETTWALRGHRQSRAAIRALLQPRSRPEELGTGLGLIPR